jgi:predicted  nucleic acid-binding Zn-ribbon protein
MPGAAAILREIHRLRRHARDLQDRIELLPRQLKAQEARTAREEQALAEAQDAVKHLKVTTHEKEVSLKTARQQIAKYEKQLDEATGKKEYDSLKAEIAAAQQKVRQLEDEILDTMLETEEQVARLPGREQAVRQAKADLARAEAELQARQGELAAQYRQAMEQVAQVEATLPAGKAREEYDRLVRARGEDALAPIQGRTCAACYTEITGQQFQDLMLGQVVLCKSCGRILYLAE